MASRTMEKSVSRQISQWLENNRDASTRNGAASLFGQPSLPLIISTVLLKSQRNCPPITICFRPVRLFGATCAQSARAVGFSHFGKLVELPANSWRLLTPICAIAIPCWPILEKLGREMIQQLEEREREQAEKCLVPASLSSHPAYAEWIPHFTCSSGPQDKPLTLLEAVQADLLLMRTPSAKIEMETGDESIQVHAADTKLREAQALYDVLQHLLAKHAHDQDPLLPEDILVMAPDMMEYVAPYQNGFLLGKGSA